MIIFLLLTKNKNKCKFSDVEKVRDGIHSNGTEEAFYTQVSESDAQKLIADARVFVDSPASEITGESRIITDTFFSVSDGLVRRATVVYDSTHGTAEIKTTVTSETAALYHPGQ